MRSSFRFVARGVAGALVMLALLLLSSTNSNDVRAAYLVADGAAGSIMSSDVDMITAGNGPTVVGAPGIDTAVSIPSGGVTTIDVAVDQIAVADGLSGFGLDLTYDATK